MMLYYMIVNPVELVGLTRHAALEGQDFSYT